MRSVGFIYTVRIQNELMNVNARVRHVHN